MQQLSASTLNLFLRNTISLSFSFFLKLDAKQTKENTIATCATDFVSNVNMFFDKHVVVIGGQLRV